MAEEMQEEAKEEEKVSEAPEKKEVERHEAFYIVPRSGGFQIRKIVIEGKTIIEDEFYSDPDAWDPVMNVIENELSRKFQ